MHERENPFNKFNDNNKLIFKNEAILFESFLPKVIVARDKQIDFISTELSPVIWGGHPGNIYASGDSGVGKTIVIRYLLKSLNDILKKRDNNNYVEIITIDCAKIRSEIPALISILGQLTHTPAKQGLQNYQYYEHIWDVINSRAAEYNTYTFMLFIDDVHLFESPDSILFEFSRALSTLDVKGDNVRIGIILASNQRGYLSRLNESVRSSCSFHYHNFPDYGADELYEILQLRKEAFTDGAMPDNVLAGCASLVADRYHGDARRAIDIVHEAAIDTIREHATKVTLRHIERAEKIVNDKITLDMLQKITLHDQLLMLAVHLASKEVQIANTGIVLSVYRAICEILGYKPNGMTHLSSRITALADKCIVDTETVKCRGNTRRITLTDDVEIVVENLFSPADMQKIRDNYYDIQSLILAKLHNSGKNYKQIHF